MGNRLRMRMLFLHEYRQEESEAALRAFVRKTAVQTGLVLVLLAMLAVVGEFGPAPSVAIVLLAGLYPLLKIRQLDQTINARKRLILLELPVFVNKLQLMLQAGLTLHAAFLRAAEAEMGDVDDGGKRVHPFARQLFIAASQLRNASPLSQVLEQLSRRCSMQEVTFFATALQMNAKRGGDELAAALGLMSRELWEKRKNAVRTLAEEASAKMLFPLMVIFLAVLIAAGAPAILLLNG